MARAATKKVTKEVTKRQPKEKVFYVLVQSKMIRDRIVGLYQSKEAAYEAERRLEGDKSFSLTAYTVQEIKLTK